MVQNKSIGANPTSADFAELLEILRSQSEIDFKPFTLTYPRDGTRLIIAAGTTTFDFLAGTVAAPGESIAEMGNSLMLQRKEFMRALTINADHDTVVRIGSADKMPVRAGSFPLFPYRQFTTVEITVTESTEILISASTSSAAIIQMGGETSPSTHEFTGDVYEGEHKMSISDAWDISTAVYAQNFSVATQEITPQGIFFKPDGLKMYVVGTDGDDVNEYDLSSGWDVSTAVWLQLFDVSPREASVQGIFFKPNGLKMYITGETGDEVNEYDLSTAWDISTAVWLQLFDVSPREAAPTGLFFNPTGSKMYIIGAAGVEVNEYDLGIAWDVTSAVWLQLLDVSAQEALPTDIFFSADGLKMYVVGSGGVEVNEYDLSTAWDVSTAVALQVMSTAAYEVSPRGIFFNPGGSKMYVVGTGGDDVNEFTIPAYRFSASKLLLRDVIIRISSDDAMIGDLNYQRYPKTAGSALGFTKVDLSKLYFSNETAGDNALINIFGMRL